MGCFPHCHSSRWYLYPCGQSYQYPAHWDFLLYSTPLTFHTISHGHFLDFLHTPNSVHLLCNLDRKIPHPEQCLGVYLTFHFPPPHFNILNLQIHIPSGLPRMLSLLSQPSLNLTSIIIITPLLCISLPFYPMSQLPSKTTTIIKCNLSQLLVNTQITGDEWRKTLNMQTGLALNVRK